MLLTEGFLGWVFWDRLNAHTFNLESGRLYKAGGFSHRADRRVKGWLRRDGWAEGWAEEWVVKPRFYKDEVFKVGGGTR